MAKTVKAQAWRSKYEPGAKIRLLAEDNPHRTGTKDRKKWSKLRRGATVRSVVEKGVDFGYLREVERRGLIEIKP